MNPEAVIFDCDGVLVDSEVVNNTVFAELVTRAGLPTTFEDSLRLYMGRSTVECIADVEAALGRPVDFDLGAAYERIVLERQRRDLRPVTGVPELLDELIRRGTAFCVASSGTPPEIEQRLTTTGLRPYFGDRVFSASMVARGKPAPDLFLLAAAHLGVAPVDCVVVEDSPFGVRAGKAAGMRVIGYAALAPEAVLRTAGADHVVGTISAAAILI